MRFSLTLPPITETPREKRSKHHQDPDPTRSALQNVLAALDFQLIFQALHDWPSRQQPGVRDHSAGRVSLQQDRWEACNLPIALCPAGEALENQATDTGYIANVRTCQLAGVQNAPENMIGADFRLSSEWASLPSQLRQALWR